MSLAHRPSTAASMLVKGRQRFGKDADHQRHLNTAEAIGMRHLDAEPPRLSNASQTLFRTREMLPDLQAEVEDDRVIREKPEEINGEAAGKMEAMIPRLRNTTMPSHNKKLADPSHHHSLAAAGIALVASIGALALRETTTEAHRGHSTNDLSEMMTGHP